MTDESAQRGVIFRWEAAAFVLAFLVQMGVMIWYESARNETVTNIAQRVTALEAAHEHDTNQLADIGKQLGQITGQLTIITTVLLAPSSHTGRSGDGR